MISRLKEFFLRPEKYTLGTESLPEILDIGIEGFKTSDLVYYQKPDWKISSCQRYFRFHGVDLLDRGHLQWLLVNKQQFPEQWKKSYLGQPRRFFFIGSFFLSGGDFHVHFVSWDKGTQKFRRGTCHYKERLNSGDVIVVAKKI